jgi:hypothetical protein
LAARIDQLVADHWGPAKVEAAPLADDAEYLRRVYLDVAGRIPSVAEARAFLDDRAADKRRRLVERLLNGPAYVSHFSTIWKGLLVPEVNTNIELQYYVGPTFDAWLRQQFAKNVPYDKMVRELLTVSVGTERQPFYIYGQQNQLSPAGFYVAKESKPENLGSSTARLFLGLKLECAQCHNHPFAKWTRGQFWEYAAFFAGFDGSQGPFAPVQERIDRLPELQIASTGQYVQAAFLDGTDAKLKYKVSPRVTLAEWMTSKTNPFFAKALANRMWAHFFGIGIVEPVDDLSPNNVPTHPELLDELAQQFVAHDFDLKFLIRAITASRAYQLTSTATHPSQEEPRLFGRMAIKGLTAEQLFDSLAQATGYRQEPRDRNPFEFGFSTARMEFLSKFNNQDKRTEFQTSILQALTLMNGKFVVDATSLDRSATLAAVIESPFLDSTQKIETLFLATLSRKPNPDELSRFLTYIQGGGPKKNPKTALGDVFWALLNSSEFMLNH